MATGKFGNDAAACLNLEDTQDFARPSKKKGFMRTAIPSLIPFRSADSLKVIRKSRT
jgi:hypothetical protein